MPDPITFVDLTASHAPVAGALRDAFDRVLRSSGFILGEKVERFEDDSAACCGLSHRAGVASGTAALTLMGLMDPGARAGVVSRRTAVTLAVHVDVHRQ